MCIESLNYSSCHYNFLSIQIFVVLKPHSPKTEYSNLIIFMPIYGHFQVSVKTTRRISRQKSARTNNVQIRGIGPGGNWASIERGDVDEVSFKMNSLSTVLKYIVSCYQMIHNAHQYT
jgi:hypothetical protein